jgi:hypothetical protein
MKNNTEKPRESQQNFHQKLSTQNSSKTSIKKPEKSCLIELPLNEEKYIIKLKVNDSSKLSLSCNAKEDFTSLYNHSIILSYEEFCDMGKSFKLCDNIVEVYNTLKNIFEEISFSCNSIKEMKANARLIQSENETISLVIKIPLISGKYEEIKIEFKKGKKDIEEQFKKMRNKYLKIKSLVYMRKYGDSKNKNNRNLLDELLEEFENDN